MVDFDDGNFMHRIEAFNQAITHLTVL